MGTGKTLFGKKANISVLADWNFFDKYLNMDGKALFETTCDQEIGKSCLLLHLNISVSPGKVAATSGVPWTPWLPPCTLGVPDWRLITTASLQPARQNTLQQQSGNWTKRAAR